jgi:hypothetical protein
MSIHSLISCQRHTKKRKCMKRRLVDSKVCLQRRQSSELSQPLFSKRSAVQIFWKASQVKYLIHEEPKPSIPSCIKRMRLSQ